MFKAAPSAGVVVAEKFVDLLQKCRQKKDLPRAKQLLASIREQHLEDHGVVGNFLVPTLVDCGGLHDAQLVFNRLPYRNVYSWTSLMLGYVGSGDPHHAFCLYHSMLRDCVPPNHHTFLALLRACHGLKGDPLELSVHADIVKCGLDRDGFLGNSLVGAYGKHGLLAEALQVFATLSDRDVVSWNALIAGYVDHGLCEEALGCLEQMQQEGPSPDDVTFVGSLKACGSARDTEKGHLLCIQIIKRGLESNVIVVNALVDMYARCGQLAEACQIFDHLPVRNIVSWNTIITAYTEVGLGEEAASCFNQMQLENVSPDEVTFACTLKVCGSLGAIEQGQILCAEIVMRGYEKSLLVGNTIIAMYAKCGLLAEAREVFASLPDQCVVSWNALITAYTEHGLGLDAISCFKQMELEGRFPDEATFISTLKACCFANDLGTGQDIHIKLSKRGLERDPHIGSSMVDMYSKCGSLIEAYQVFEKLRARDEVLWNTMISGFVEHGLGEETLNCYEKMQLERVIPVVVTYVCGLKACGITGAVETGQQLHTEIARRGMEGDPSVGNTLVDMYGKCGLLAEGRKVFDMLSVQNVVSWNALITGYGENHEAGMALQCFEDMTMQGVKPDIVTFTCLLVACSHASLVLEGQEFFNAMREDHDFEPMTDHYACMVDLLARSGHVYEADKYAEAMECLPSEGTLRALLTGCKIHGEVELGHRYFRQLVQMNQEDASAYTLMADVYASAGMGEEANRLEKARKCARAKKMPARASVEVNKDLQEFVVGVDQGNQILEVLDDLKFYMKNSGHVPNVVVSFAHVHDD